MSDYIKIVNGEPVPMTPEEITERQAEEALPPPPPPLINRLTAIFNGLPVEMQAAFGPLASAVFMFLTQDNPAAAKLVIQGATVPSEFESVRTQMLSVFEQGD